MEKAEKSLKQIYKGVFYPSGLEFNDMVELSNLMVIVYNSAKKKDPEETLLNVMTKVTLSQPLNLSLLYDPLSIVIDTYLEDNNFTPRNYGFTTVKDILNRISELIDKYVPF